jgi:hypothetical protein
MTPNTMTAIAAQATRRIKLEVPRTLFGAKLEQLIAIGFNVVPDIRGVIDETNYCICEFPVGWSVRNGQSHSYTSAVLDQHGRQRATMYSKMDYANRCRDRRWMEFCRRFAIDVSAYGGSPNKRAVVIRDADKVLHEVGKYRTDRNDLDTKCRLELLAREWLNERYPQHTEPMAHWDDAPMPVVAAVQAQAVADVSV